jgi:hypothetical protein
MMDLLSRTDATSPADPQSYTEGHLSAARTLRRLPRTAKGRAEGDERPYGHSLLRIPAQRELLMCPSGAAALDRQAPAR